jgi:hypothetical protein
VRKASAALSSASASAVGIQGQCPNAVSGFSSSKPWTLRPTLGKSVTVTLALLKAELRRSVTVPSVLPKTCWPLALANEPAANIEVKQRERAVEMLNILKDPPCYSHTLTAKVVGDNIHSRRFRYSH